MRLFVRAVLFFGSVIPALALTPIEHYNSLVAGGDDAGYQDGNFYLARFSHPSGLCFDDKGEKLFVADRDNNRVRVVDLGQENSVGTLSGNGTAGRADGSLSKATFDHPEALAFLPPDRVAVFDAGTRLIRIINLHSRSVTTAPGGPVGGVWNLVYSPKDASLYFTEPAEGRMERLDLKAGKIFPVLVDSPQLPHPQALCYLKDSLYAADRDLPTVYRLTPPLPAGAAGTSAVLTPVGQAEHVQELTGTDGVLYALQAGATPLEEILPSSRAVSLATPWGVTFDQPDAGAEPLIKFDPGVPVGFAASAKGDRKLFISYPVPGFNELISVADYDFGRWWKSYSNFNNADPNGSLCDFDYPRSKPPRTFRILVVGESRVLTAPIVTQDAPVSFNEYNWTIATIRTNTFPKRLELLLNTEGALRGSNTRFQVLVLGAHGWGPSSYVYDTVPVFAARYDVDLVLVLTGIACYEDYFTKPIRPDGIPEFQLDPSYLLKPLSSRIPPGVPARFYQDCLKKGILKEGQGFPFWWTILHEADREIRDDMMEMTARPLRLLSDKLKSMRTSGGKAPQLAFLYLPNRDWGYQDECEAYWVDLCRRNHLPLLDLSGPFTALKASYYPTTQTCCMHHYTGGGNWLIAELLNYYLREGHWIPLQDGSPDGDFFQGPHP